jgi:hypothetical protein
MQRYSFDKFMDRLVIEEKKKDRRPEQAETPQRALVRRYAESPDNRTRYAKKPGAK